MVYSERVDSRSVAYSCGKGGGPIFWVGEVDSGSVAYASYGKGGGVYYGGL